MARARLSSSLATAAVPAVGVTAPAACLPSPPCKMGRAPRLVRAGQEAGSGAGRAPQGND